jgi:hypothetical protein
MGFTANQYRFFSIAFVTLGNQTSAPDTGIMDELRHDQFLVQTAVPHMQAPLPSILTMRK